MSVQSSRCDRDEKDCADRQGVLRICCIGPKPKPADPVGHSILFFAPIAPIGTVKGDRDNGRSAIRNPFVQSGKRGQDRNLCCQSEFLIRTQDGVPDQNSRAFVRVGELGTGKSLFDSFARWRALFKLGELLGHLFNIFPVRFVSQQSIDVGPER